MLTTFKKYSNMHNTYVWVCSTLRKPKHIECSFNRLLIITRVIYSSVVIGNACFIFPLVSIKLNYNARLYSIQFERAQLKRVVSWKRFFYHNENIEKKNALQSKANISSRRRVTMWTASSTMQWIYVPRAFIKQMHYHLL